jgi:hypothetical protein
MKDQWKHLTDLFEEKKNEKRNSEAEGSMDKPEMTYKNGIAKQRN